MKGKEREKRRSKLTILMMNTFVRSDGQREEEDWDGVHGARKMGGGFCRARESELKSFERETSRKRENRGIRKWSMRVCVYVGVCVCVVSSGCVGSSGTGASQVARSIDRPCLGR